MSYPESLLHKYATQAPEVPAGATQVASPADVPTSSPWLRAAGIIGAGVGGTILGGLAGAGLGKALDHFHMASTGTPVDTRYLRFALPVVGLASGLVGKMWQDHQNKELSNAYKDARNARSRSSAG